MSADAPTAKLYTAELLSLATELASYPLTYDLSRRAQARSRTCGSTLEMGLEVSPDGAITTLGMRVSACAVGQAAAALFARSASGKTLSDCEDAEREIATWLEQGGDLPQWPGLQALSAARPHSARHGAILLPWKAAIAALSS